MRTTAGTDSFSLWVDLARWMAAMSVLITHAGLRLLAPVGDIAHPSWPQLAYAFVAGFDHQAVMVFFVLSGLLVGGSVVREIEATGSISFARYAGRRLVRLWVVLLPAMALGGVCTAFALSLGAADRGILPADAADTLSAPVLLCNAAFLQTAVCSQFAANGALWSLFNEFWYYALFPPFALAVAGMMHPLRRIVFGGLAGAVLAGLTALQFTGSSIGPYMLVWLVGVAAARLPRPVMPRPWLAAALFIAGSLAVRLFVRRSFAGLHPILSAELDLALALLFGSLLLTLRCWPALWPPPWPRLHTALAGFSFSLYCTHVPVLSLYVSVLVTLTGHGWHMRGAGAEPWLAVGGGLVLCLGVGWAFSRLTEVHTGQVRSWFARRWPVQQAALGEAR